MRRRAYWMIVPALVLLLVAGIAVAVNGGLQAGSTPPAAGTRTSRTPSPQGDPGTLYRRAMAAMRSSKGVHYVSTGGGQTIVGDAGPHGGRQDITVSTGYGFEQFTLLAVEGTVYFQGDAAALQDQLGVPFANAPALAGKWVSVSAGDGPYQVIAPGISIGDQTDEAALEAAKASRTTVKGIAVERIAGTVPPQHGAPGGTGYLDVAVGTGLPLDYAVRVGSGGRVISLTTTFSKWGHAPAVTAPADSVAWSSLGAVPPPGGYGGGGSGGAPPTML